jgi:uncharacterized protein (TIGR02246 family)
MIDSLAGHRTRALLLVMFLIAFKSAFSQEQRGDIPADARRTIADANSGWLRAMKSGDAAATAAPYADDAVFVTALGESVRGRSAIERLMQDRFAASGRAVDGAIQQDGLTKVGDRIYEWGHATLMLARDGAKPSEFKGRYLTVWAADAAGHWRIIRNLSLAF